MEHIPSECEKAYRELTRQDSSPNKPLLDPLAEAERELLAACERAIMALDNSAYRSQATQRGEATRLQKALHHYEAAKGQA